MPATVEEIEGEEEGVHFHFLVTPVAVLGGEHVSGVRLQRQRLGDYDSSGRRRPVPVPGSEYDMPCDLLIPAIGQITWVEDESLGMHRKATFDVGKAFELNVPGVFAAGDSVSGPGTVVQSVGHGNLVAQAVDAYLTTGELSEVYVKPKLHDIPQLYDLDEFADALRPEPVMLTPA
jgi:NADPH-dependent glutamate synthase beta subunit-like oxidoreductase